MDREIRWSTVHGCKELDTTEWLILSSFSHFQKEKREERVTNIFGEIMAENFLKLKKFPHKMKPKRSTSRHIIWSNKTTEMDLEGIMLSEISQRKTNTVWYHLYSLASYIFQIPHITKKKRTHRFTEQTTDYQSDEWRGRDKMGVGNLEIATIMQNKLWEYIV